MLLLLCSNICQNIDYQIGYKNFCYERAVAKKIMDIVIYLINNSEEDVLVCGRAEEICSTLNYSSCSFAGGARISPGQFGRLNISLRLPYEKVCMALWKSSSCPENGYCSPDTITTIDTTAQSLAIVAIWDGQTINIKERYGRSRSNTSSISRNKKTYFINNQTSHSVYICPEGSNDCGLWTVDNNPCGNQGLLVEANSISNLELDVFPGNEKCMAVWLNPNAPNRSEGSRSFQSTAPMRVINIDSSDTALLGGEITIMGMEPNTEFRLVDYFVEQHNPLSVRPSVRPSMPIYTAPAPSPGYIGGGSIIAIIIIILIIIVIIGYLAYVFGIYKGNSGKENSSDFSWGKEE